MICAPIMATLYIHIYMYSWVTLQYINSLHRLLHLHLPSSPIYKFFKRVRKSRNRHKMHFSTLTSLVLAAAASAQQFMVPAPWYVRDIRIGNIRHGTGGLYVFPFSLFPPSLIVPPIFPFLRSPIHSLTQLPNSWSLNLIDTPTPAPQGLNTTCSYSAGWAYTYALDGAPINEPCNDPNVTFGLFPDGDHFTLNITHLYGDCGRCVFIFFFFSYFSIYI
jgi:hypothetical protein